MATGTSSRLVLPRKALKLDEDNPIANLRMGKLLYMHKRKIDEAIHCFEKVKSDLDIGYKACFEVTLFDQLGSILYDTGRNKIEGLNLIKGSIEKKPEYITAWNKLGKIMEEKASDLANADQKDKYLKLSKKFYDKSLAIDAYNFQGRLGIATYYFKLAEYKKCDHELKKITLPQETNDVRCLKLKADNYFAMEEYEQSLDMYLKCKNIEGSFKDEVQMSIGNCYYTMDDYKNATKTFLDLEQRLPLDVDLKIKLAACYMMQKNVNMAVEVFKKCIKLDPNRWDIYLYLAKVYMHDSNFEEAAKCIRSYNHKNPEDITGHLKLAEMYEALGAHQSAVEELDVN